MKRIKIPCASCNGTGATELPEHLTETLRFVRGGVTAKDVAANTPGVTTNAQNNRLEHLRALGLVKRRRVGRFWMYSRVTH